jgi:hypothetical protein
MANKLLVKIKAKAKAKELKFNYFTVYNIFIIKAYSKRSDGRL